MTSIISQSGRETAYLTEFIADNEVDIIDLPGIGQCAPGSTCFVIETSEVYMLKTDGTWKVI